MRLNQILKEYVDIDKTVNQVGNKLTARFAEDRSINDDYDVSEFITYIRDKIDPTDNHQYTLWILRTYIKSGIKLAEDMSRINAALQLYHNNKNQVKIKDINQLKSVTDLEDQVEDINSEEKSGKEQKRQLSNEIKKQTKIVYKGPEGNILIPTTKEASCFWGKGTRWCTASTDSDNYFNHYNKDGPLYIILPKDGTKWQFHLESSSLMDAKDEEVDFIKFKKKYPWVFNKITFSEKIQLAAVKQNGYAIRFINNPSEKIQLAAVKQNGNSIRFINNPSEKIQLVAVNEYGHAIKFIDNPSEKIQLVAVNEYRHAIRFINNPSEKIQLAAVKQNGNSIRFINNPSEKIQLVAVNEYGHAIKFIDNPSEKIQLYAVKENGYAIKYIDNPSKEVQLAARKN